ncbi:MAG TPA: cation diffusion facilitator family transporter [Candidatus Limnocylindrales bacterium]|nr:cation diffusion facilitator family transporter [Candidatus Limnocylindrales bacterium]
MHIEAHSHDRGHGGAHVHNHELGAGGELPSSGVMAGAVGASLLLVAAELVGGVMGHSIALISDAVHNLSDVPSLLIAWLGMRWAERPANAEKTYGYHRAGILAAFINATLLVVVAGFIIVEAWERFRNPDPVHTGLMIWISVLALAINGGITLSVVRGRRDLNVRAIFIHNLGDALSNVGILTGALLIRAMGAQWLDPLLGAMIGALVLWSSIGILREASHILLEGLPRGMELPNVARVILAAPGVQEVHDIHVWTLGTDLHALSCHICIPDMHMEQSEQLLHDIRKRLADEFHITHTTIQFERAGLPKDTGFYMPEPFRPQQ